jgi:hypothetical protein
MDLIGLYYEQAETMLRAALINANDGVLPDAADISLYAHATHWPDHVVYTYKDKAILQVESVEHYIHKGLIVSAAGY